MPKVEVKIIKEDEEIHHKKKRGMINSLFIYSGKWSKESKYEDDIYLPSHNLYRTAKIADIKKRSHNVSKSK